MELNENTIANFWMKNEKYRDDIFQFTAFEKPYRGDKHVFMVLKVSEPTSGPRGRRGERERKKEKDLSAGAVWTPAVGLK